MAPGTRSLGLLTQRRVMTLIEDKSLVAQPSRSGEPYTLLLSEKLWLDRAAGNLAFGSPLLQATSLLLGTPESYYPLLLLGPSGFFS